MSTPFVLVFAAGAAEANRQIALKFASRHPIAFLCSPNHTLSTVVSAARDAGSEAVLFETDLSSVESVKASIDSAVAHFGKQCAAAILQAQEESTDAQVPFLEQTAIQFHLDTTAQIASAYAFSQAAMPLLTYGGGSADFPAALVLVGPRGASRGDKIVDNAFVALSRSLGREYGKKYIHVAHLKFNKTALAESKADDEQRNGRVADTLWYLYTQPFSCFANEITI